MSRSVFMYFRRSHLVIGVVITGSGGVNYNGGGLGWVCFYGVGWTYNPV